MGGGSGGRGGRLAIQKRPGGRGAGGMGVEMTLRSSRARTSISSITSATGRRTTLPTPLLSFAPRSLLLAPCADMAEDDGDGEFYGELYGESYGELCGEPCGELCGEISEHGDQLEAVMKSNLIELV